jgi:hypothetical protein
MQHLKEFVILLNVHLDQNFISRNLLFKNKDTPVKFASFSQSAPQYKLFFLLPDVILPLLFSLKHFVTKKNQWNAKINNNN